MVIELEELEGTLKRHQLQTKERKLESEAKNSEFSATFGFRSAMSNSNQGNQTWSQLEIVYTHLVSELPSSVEAKTHEVNFEIKAC